VFGNPWRGQRPQKEAESDFERCVNCTPVSCCLPNASHTPSPAFPIGGWHRLERWVAPIGKVGGTDWEGGWHRLGRWVAPIGKVGGTD
jgi:hypothetical protein